MSIVKMKRLRLVAMRGEQEELLRALQHRGCVEISEQPLPEEEELSSLARPDAGALARAREARATLDSALNTLRKYAPEKGGMFQSRPEVVEHAFFDQESFTSALKSAQDLLDRDREHAALQAGQQKLLAQKQSIAPWLGLDLPLETVSTRDVSIHFAAVAASADLSTLAGALAQASELTELIPAGKDRELQYFVLFCHKAEEEAVMTVLKEQGYTRANLKGWTGTAAENDRRLDDQLAQNQAQLKKLESEIAGFAPLRPTFQQTLDRADQDIRREEARSRLVDGQAAFYLDGWIPADAVPQLAKDLDGRACAWETSDPQPDDYPQVPVKLKNNFVTRSMNTITEMYSLPAYDGIDPNPLMAPFFILFFGMIMADMAYGLLMVIASGVVLLKAKPKNPNFMEMIFWCGISTILWGAASGGFFGDMIPQLVTMINPESTFVMPSLFTALDDIVAIMIGSLVLGVIQVFTGMAVSVWKKSKDGEFIDALFNEISWWIILAGLAMFICGMMLPAVPAVLGTVGKVMLIVGFLMLAIGGTREAKGFGKLTSFVGIIYNGVTGFFSDILSYIRLMALMVSGSVIASVFNTLGATTGIVPVFILISLLGNALNLALSLLGAYVHDLRLQCLEFFGRFYKEGGKPYQPLTIDTKYVDIIKEEN